MKTDATISVVEEFDPSTGDNYFYWSVVAPDGGVYADGESPWRDTAISYAKQQYRDWLNKQ